MQAWDVQRNEGGLLWARALNSIHGHDKGTKPDSKSGGVNPDKESQISVDEHVWHGVDTRGGGSKMDHGMVGGTGYGGGRGQPADVNTLSQRQPQEFVYPSGDGRDRYYTATTIGRAAPSHGMVGGGSGGRVSVSGGPEFGTVQAVGALGVDGGVGFSTRRSTTNPYQHAGAVETQTPPYSLRQRQAFPAAMFVQQSPEAWRRRGIMGTEKM